jgi:DnaJ like chaperone protein
LVFLFALIGLFSNGLRGLVVGALLGYAVNWLVKQFLFGHVKRVQSQFLDSTFAVMGAVCKADGAVTHDEIQRAESMFERLSLSPEQRKAAIAAFSRGKAEGFDLDGECEKFARGARNARPFLLMFLQLQYAAVAADGVLHPAEQEILKRVAGHLGLSPIEMAQFEAQLRGRSAGSSGSGYTGSYGPAPQSKLEDAYAALGLTASATDTEIKRAYRKLMSENHPDKLASKGLPESMRLMAEERTREISTAYTLVKEARGFN